MKEYIKIGQIISKKLLSEATPEELRQLNKWLANEDNLQTFNSITPEKIESRLAQYKAIDLAGALNKYLEKTSPKIPAWKIFLRYAAVSIILISVGITTYLIFQQPPSENMEISEKIIPGETKAILTLANGQNLTLQRETDSTFEENNAKIINRNGNLQYQSRNKTQSVVQYNTLKVPRGGEYKLTLADGTIVWLNAKSELRFPIAFNGEKRQVHLLGEAYFDVAHNPSKPFIVTSKKQNIEVLGTEFNISAYPDEGQTITTLVSGSVQASLSTHSNQLVKKILKPDQQLIFDTNSSSNKIIEVDTYLYTAWKEGRFVFRNQSLENIFKGMSRWYDIEFEFANQNVANKTFSIDIHRNDPFEKVIRVLELTNVIKIHTTGNKVIVKEIKK